MAIFAGKLEPERKTTTLRRGHRRDTRWILVPSPDNCKEEAATPKDDKFNFLFRLALRIQPGRTSPGPFFPFFAN